MLKRKIEANKEIKKRARTLASDITSLSNEIVMHILYYLPHQDILTMLLVNQFFHTLASDIHIWQPLFEYHYWPLVDGNNDYRRLIIERRKLEIGKEKEIEEEITTLCLSLNEVNPAHPWFLFKIENTSLDPKNDSASILQSFYELFEEKNRSEWPYLIKFLSDLPKKYQYPIVYQRKLDFLYQLLSTRISELKYSEKNPLAPFISTPFILACTFNQPSSILKGIAQQEAIRKQTRTSCEYYQGMICSAEIGNLAMVRKLYALIADLEPTPKSDNVSRNNPMDQVINRAAYFEHSDIVQFFVNQLGLDKVKELIRNSNLASDIGLTIGYLTTGIYELKKDIPLTSPEFWVIVLLKNNPTLIDYLIRDLTVSPFNILAPVKLFKIAFLAKNSHAICLLLDKYPYLQENSALNMHINYEGKTYTPLTLAIHFALLNYPDFLSIVKLIFKKLLEKNLYTPLNTPEFWEMTLSKNNPALTDYLIRDLTVSPFNILAPVKLFKIAFLAKNPQAIRLLLDRYPYLQENSALNRHINYEGKTYTPLTLAIHFALLNYPDFLSIVKLIFKKLLEKNLYTPLNTPEFWEMTLSKNDGDLTQYLIELTTDFYEVLEPIELLKIAFLAKNPLAIRLLFDKYSYLQHEDVLNTEIHCGGKTYTPLTLAIDFTLLGNSEFLSIADAIFENLRETHPFLSASDKYYILSNALRHNHRDVLGWLLSKPCVLSDNEDYTWLTKHLNGVDFETIMLVLDYILHQLPPDSSARLILLDWAYQQEHGVIIARLTDHTSMEMDTAIQTNRMHYYFPISGIQFYQPALTENADSSQENPIEELNEIVNRLG